MKHYITIDQMETFLPFSHPVYTLASHKKSRREQDEALVDKIISRAFSFLPDDGNRIHSDRFFVGTVDIMGGLDANGDKQFHILEINGGSARGLASLAEHQIERVYDGYLEALNVLEADSPKIVIGHLDRDILLYEKWLLLNRLSVVASIPDENIIIEPYSALIPKLTFDSEKIYYQTQPIDLIIGDGVARRIHGFSPSKGFQPLIVNNAYPITDDKFLTYAKIDELGDILRPLSVKPLNFWLATNKEELSNTIRKYLDSYEEVVIKPSQSSGGCGIEFIHHEKDIDSKIEQSINSYRKKFGARRDPFPYTITEKINPLPCEFHGEKRAYDIKIHLARKGNRIFAVGGKFRVAAAPLGIDETESYITNLTAKDGLAAERALGINEENLRKLNLDIDDLAKCFAAAMVVGCGL